MGSNGRQPKTALQIVNELFIKATRNENGCLISHLRPNAKGYVPVQVGGRLGEKWRAHRLVFTVMKGQVESHLMVLHTCDTRNCIEPDHLFKGTAKDNTQDMMVKGRNKFILPNNQKVNPDTIRAMSATGMTGRAIAEELGVAPTTISNYLSKNGVYRDR
jgi:hypothetical protein